MRFRRGELSAWGRGAHVGPVGRALRGGARGAGGSGGESSPPGGGRMTFRRWMVRGLGAGTVVFGVAPALFPRFFGRMFGIAAVDDPTVATVIRSVGIRDLVIGVGLLRAARV